MDLIREQGACFVSINVGILILLNINFVINHSVDSLMMHFQQMRHEEHH
jgi:hypothetical protein